MGDQDAVLEAQANKLAELVCLCAAHHREIHVGRRAADLVSALRAIVR